MFRFCNHLRVVKNKNTPLLLTKHHYNLYETYYYINLSVLLPPICDEFINILKIMVFEHNITNYNHI